jgi:GTP cyclohydrolase I
VPAPRKGELVIASQIDFHAMCPHHLLPYKGSAAVGYVADQWLVGFGKIAEATDALAHRLILQEQLVHRLCESVVAALNPLGAGVVITAEHGCMQVRGPTRRQSRITVEAWAGAFEKDAELRHSLARRAEGG